MSTGRKLQPGDNATTDFNGNGIVQVKILARYDNTRSQSGIMFQVTPRLKNCDVDTWIDADWFEQTIKVQIEEQMMTHNVKLTGSAQLNTLPKE